VRRKNEIDFEQGGNEMATYSKLSHPSSVKAGDKPRGREIQLETREVYKLDRWHGTLDIRNERGILWVTISGDPEDHLLRSGERMTVRNYRQVVVEAIQASRFRVQNR
jgi:hypothetical protein